ncbi:MAG: hypothetical protein ACQEXQ_01880 [Bacillota bacterium]
MDATTQAEQIRELVERLCRDAGYAAPELLAYIEKLEENNRQMNQSLKKLKLDAVRRASASAGMNSRLKDALRE